MAGRPTAKRWPLRRARGEFDIYTIPPPRQGNALTTAKGLDDGPEFTPDGRLIVFNSERTGRNADLANENRRRHQTAVTSDDYNNWFPHPSPDGKYLVFLSYAPDVRGHPENKDVTLRMLSLATQKITVLARLFGGQGTINVPCCPRQQEIAFRELPVIP